MFEGLTVSEQLLGEKAGPLFGTEDKTTAEVEKKDNAKIFDEDEIKKKSGVISTAASDACKKIVESASVVKSDCIELAVAGKEKVEQGFQAVADAAHEAFK